MANRRTTCAGSESPRFEPLEPRLFLDADLLISEFLAANSSGITDENGDTSDWIEIRNQGLTPADLTGWHLTDDAANLDKWHFPAVTIDPNSYLIVWASDKNRATPGSPLHTNFKLGAEGEYLALVAPDGTTIASEYWPTFPPQESNISYGTSETTTTATLISADSAAKYLVPTDGSLGVLWLGADFNDASWTSGLAGVGFETIPQLTRGLAGEGTFYLAPYGEGGTWNLYEVVTTTKTWIAAYNDAKARTQCGQAGHLVTIANETEDQFVRRCINTNYWIGLTDSDTFAALGAHEDGNTSTLPLPPDGVAPVEGERGHGFVWITGEPFTYQKWYTGNPNNNNKVIGSEPGEDAVSMRTNGEWQDDRSGEGTQTGTNRPYVIEYELRLPAVGPSFNVQEVHSATTLSNVDAAATLLAAGGGTTYTVPFINFADPQNTAAGRFAGNLAFGGDTAIDDNYFALRFTGTVKIPSAGAWTFGLKSDDGFILRIKGAAFTSVTNLSGTATLSGDIMRRTSGAGEALGYIENLAAGDYDVEITYYEGTGSSGIEFFAQSGQWTAWDTGFRLVGDSLLNTGLALHGIGDLVTTDVAAGMQGANASAYVRIPFTVTNVDDIDYLTLSMQYDDGFVAYLNGVEVARANAPTTPDWNSAATAENANNGALSTVTYDLYRFKTALQAGTNVLAIQGLNSSAADTDFLVRPELVGTTILSTANRYFLTPSPGQPNSAGIAAFVSDTHFSDKRGFYTAPLDVVLTCDTPGAVIRYTTDGSTPTEAIGTVYTAPVHIDHTTTLRVAAFKTDWGPSNVDTNTYLFLYDIITQSANGEAPAGWPTVSINGQIFNYGMDPEVVNDPRYYDLLDDALLAIPSISLVTDLANLFDPTTGIYVNADKEGIAWERPTSVELINPDGTTGFQIDAGLRIRGGYSRSDNNPKHAFRLFFRSDYGDAKLEYPLFGDEGVDEFDCVDLRTSQNYSWSFAGDTRNIMIRDLFNRQTQADMGQPYTRSRFYHLYINGQYWGLFMTEERPEASYAQSYFGGNKDDYDVIKVEAGAYTVVATDGNLDAWTDLWSQAVAGFATDAAYYKVQGLNPDGTRNPDYAVLLDVDNLCDYMISVYWSGDLDAPLSNFLANKKPNNFYAIRDRTGDKGFIYFRHDGEHTLLDVNQDRTGPWTDAQLQQLQYFNPQWLHQQLCANAEYRQHFADRVQKWFFDDGVLTPEANLARFNALAAEIEMAIIGESARWGDSKVTTPRTKDDDWLPTLESIRTNFLPLRTGIVLNQFKADGWYPAIDAPTLNQHGGTIPSDAPYFDLALTAPAGTIYYTLDGTDPRLPGGDIATGAHVYTDAVPLTRSTLVKARVWDAATSTWSALEEATFVVDTPPALVVTEIMYHPQDPASGSPYLDDDFQYIELQNIGDDSLNLAGFKIAGGVDFEFPGMDLAPGQYVLVVSNEAAFRERYPSFAGLIAGEFSRFLSHDSESLRIEAGLDGTILNFKYQDSWFPQTDGEGFSLVTRDAQQDSGAWDAEEGWRPSMTNGGAPGQADPGLNPNAVVINEVLAHQDQDDPGDWIELKNTTGAPIDISGWYLSDDPLDLLKYRIPDATPAIPAAGFAVFTEHDHFGPAFALSELGDAVYLTSSPAPGEAGGYRESEDFGPSDRGVTLGRYIKSTGGKDFVALSAATPDAANAYPLVGPVVINEVMYNPLLTGDEYIELYNRTADCVALHAPGEEGQPDNPWQFTAGITFAFPLDAAIPAHGYALVVAIDPAAFRAKYAVPESVLIYGPYSGSLDNNGETVELARPGAPEPGGFVPYYRADRVTYNDASPWPTRPDGNGSSLNRLAPADYGNDVANWGASTTPGSPGRDNVPIDLTPPTVPGGLAAVIVSTTQVDLAWTGSTDPESGLAYTCVYRNGTFIASTAGTAWSDTHVVPAVTYAYQVTAVNIDDAQSAPSNTAEARIVTLASTDPDTASAVLVVFTEAMDPTSAQNPAHYAITYGTDQSLAIATASLGADELTVTLTVATPMVFDTLYTLTVTNVLSQTGFSTAPGSQKTFYYYLKGTGTILREWWTGIAGGTVNLLTASADYPYFPAGRDERNLFEGPSNWADTYGTRMRGYVTAPLTGNYLFWVASDDASELWLSTDENPANAVKIAYVSTYTSSRQWTKEANQQSVPIALVAGQRYYIEVLQKEGTGSDNLAVGWQLPNGTYERPIPGVRLSPYFPEATGDPNPPNLPTVTVAATDPTADENGQNQATFTFTRTGYLAPAVTVYYTFGGTAAISDYVENLSGSIVIPANQASATLHITPQVDDEAEAVETVALTIAGGHPAYVLGAQTADQITIADDPFPTVAEVHLNGRADRAVSSVDPSGIGVRTLTVRFSEPMTFADADVLVQKVTFPGGVEALGTTITPVIVGGSGTDTMTLTLPNASALDTWVKITLTGSGTLKDLMGHRLDGEPQASGSQRGYVWDGDLDLPTGDGAVGGDTVFYVGSLRGDFNGDLTITPADKDGFCTAWHAGDLDADFRGVGFGVRPPDGQITKGDIDGFTSVYQAAMATGRRLDDLPDPGYPLAAALPEGGTVTRPLAWPCWAESDPGALAAGTQHGNLPCGVPASAIDILAAAAFLPLPAAAPQPLLATSGSIDALAYDTDDMLDEVEDLLSKKVRPLAVGSGTPTAVLRL